MESREAEIKELEEKLIQAMREPDLTFLESIFSDNYVFMGSGNLSWGKSKALDDFRDPGFELQKLEIRDRRIFLHENTAVVTGLSVVEGLVDKDKLTGQYRFMRVWTRTGDHWRIASVFTSPA